ncbi:hypothetical protein BOX15_Mlig029830g3, partial [Macrostomum lignano]
SARQLCACRRCLTRSPRTWLAACVLLVLCVHYLLLLPRPLLTANSDAARQRLAGSAGPADSRDGSSQRGSEGGGGNSDSGTPPRHPRLQFACRRSDAPEWPVDLGPLPAGQLKLRSDAKILLLVDNENGPVTRQLINLLEHMRLSYKTAPTWKPLPHLTSSDRGRFGAILMDSLSAYLNMDRWNRGLLDRYCRDYAVGQVAAMLASGGGGSGGVRRRRQQQRRRRQQQKLYRNGRLGDLPVWASPVSIGDLINSSSSGSANIGIHVSRLSPVTRLTKSGILAELPLPGDTGAGHWMTFNTSHEGYGYVAWFKSSNKANGDSGGDRLATVLSDSGRYDGIARVIFGYDFSPWLHAALLADALAWTSRGRFAQSLDRFVQVDIDDVFVGPSGLRMLPNDVDALVATQRRWRSRFGLSGFTFQLGFSGRYFGRGNPAENAGDARLLTLRRHFLWFPHMYKHNKPHTYASAEALEAVMLKNKDWAIENDLPISPGYAVSPHHSGVYPVHEPLYAAWRSVWSINVTSTEEYPHLRPARRRRGFVYNGVRVLPRETCGIYTHTVRLADYPRGQQRLRQLVLGGELFHTVLLHPICVFMTHMPNYANDRLAYYVFDGLFNFLTCHTNIRLRWADPQRLATLYFNSAHREERQAPLWLSPCADPRHREIWAGPKDLCARLPSLLIVGPQKTGSTALHTFLSLHPQLLPSIKHPRTFEEVQFFTDPNYAKGLLHYYSYFNYTREFTVNFTVDPGARPIYFEKSANYFDQARVPGRVKALLPSARIVAILMDPAQRAYSWYQHQLAHGDPAATNYSFYQVITSDDAAPREVRQLRHRCLRPGRYANILKRWFRQYRPRSVYLVDGDQLRNSPAQTVHRLQRWLGLKPQVDYTQLLLYNKRKGFYCYRPVLSDLTVERRPRCLGKGKGRRYPAIDEASLAYLRTYYRHDNAQLYKLLRRHSYKPPGWLLALQNGGKPVA